ncbi:hypothetical protein ACFVZM_28530 [Streptomyces sioyaensis]|uniref:hypothetical protein n=1 Tax=Streptomyces sioyaensis TaxID=67364 RepID=UPI0036C89E82
MPPQGSPTVHRHRHRHRTRHRTRQRRPRTARLPARRPPAAARLAPEPALRGLDGIAGRRPRAGTYAAGTPGTRNAAQPRERE